jgi:hypothetical protein
LLVGGDVNGYSEGRDGRISGFGRIGYRIRIGVRGIGGSGKSSEGREEGGGDRVQRAESRKHRSLRWEAGSGVQRRVEIARTKMNQSSSDILTETARKGREKSGAI